MNLKLNRLGFHGEAPLCFRDGFIPELEWNRDLTRLYILIIYRGDFNVPRNIACSILNTLLILHLAEQNNERFTGILR